MQRLIKLFFICGALLVAGWQQAWGFALLGPIGNGNDSWQTIVLGYGLAYESFGESGGPVFLGDIGAPKNYPEGYRRNDPVLYYAYDEDFSGYFGAQGEAACDQAFAIMNNFFTNHPNGVDGYSPNLTEFPFNSQHFNGTAQGLFLTDLKSVTLHCLVEQMGLAEPERYTWTLRQRFEGPSPPPCPENVNYVVIQRNYGISDQPLTGPNTGTIYSPYVNNLLYTYGIAEDCGHHPPDWTAITIPFSTDTTVPEYTAVAANDFESGPEPGLGGLDIGGFYSGLTEDDAAGMRFLMTSNNLTLETPATGSQWENTNFNTLNLLVTSNLATLLEFASTNPPAAVQAAFPNVQIDTVSNFFVVVTNPVIVSYLTNNPGDPADLPPHLVVVTNGFFKTFPEEFAYTFGNIVIVHEHTNTPAKVQTISIANKPGDPAGLPPQTNITTTTTILKGVISGDYYTLPPGSCGIDIVSTLATNNPAGSTTNVITSFADPNTGAISTQSIITKFTNDVFEYYACTLTTNPPAKYQGIQHVQFVRVSDNNVDPLTGAFYQPFTNSYPMVWYNPTNSQLGVRRFLRIITAPDFLLTAADNVGANTFVGTVTRDINFETGQVLPNSAGPGVIDQETTFSYNKVGTAWWNGPFVDTNSFVDGQLSGVNQSTAITSVLWGSFDGTTNTPIVYPTGASIQELESQMIISISPTNLPDGTNGVPYVPTPLSATGGSTPYTWSVSGLPSGLALLGGNVIEGTPNVTITNGVSQVFDVTVQLMDSSQPANIVTMPMTITIH
ncbi:MAG TPA: hypothetical protein VMH87_01250 [Pseudomonadales bacterium]|nr:hypothetical protein [Pseudomonadales bacterium]